MLQQLGIEVLFQPYVRSIADLLGQARPRVRHGDAVAPLHRGQAHRRGARVRAQRAVVFDTVDLHFLRDERLAELDGGVTARARRARQAQRGARADPQGGRDAGRVAARAGAARRDRAAGAACWCCPTSTRRCPNGKPFAQREGLVFIGGFRHPPNADAVLWYAREILPRVRERLPGVKTYIVGSNVPADDQGARRGRLRRRGLRPGHRAVLHRLPRLDLAAALRRRREGQGQSRDELRPAGRRDVAVDRRHVSRRPARTCWSPTSRRRSPTRWCRRTGRGAVATARRGRPREHPHALLARRRAQRHHAPDRARASRAAWRRRKRPDRARRTS